MSVGRVFILESPNPLDLLENRGERLALEQVCKLVGYDAVTFLVRDRAEFHQTCRYISSIEGDENEKTPLFLHISVHGNATGIAVGRDTLDWQELAEATQDMYEHLKFYHGLIVFILSACGANKQKLTAKLTKGMKGEKSAFIPPEYLFVFSDDTVLWDAAVVTWTIFYREAVELDFTDKSAVKKLLDKLQKSGFGNLKYYRWDSNDKKYFQWDSNIKK